MEVKRVAGLLKEIKGMKVAVFGDIMLDRYIWGRVERVSPEAPVQVVEIEREEEDIGGAGNILKNLIAWGAEPVFVGCVGDDEEGERVREKLRSFGVNPEYTVVVKDGRTTVKTRIMAGSQHILRLDRDSRPNIPEDAIKSIKNALKEVIEEAKGLIVSDYMKGTIPRPLPEIIPKGIDVDVTVDPKRENLSFYQGASFIKPNLREFSRAAAFEHIHDIPLEEAGRLIAKKHNLKGLLLTLGKEGMILFRGDTYFRIKAEAREVYDVTGAGDTVISVFSAMLFAGASPEEAALISNRAASVSVGKVGARPVHPHEVFPFLRDEKKAPPLERLKDILKEERKRGKKIAMTSGFFDLIHPGQILFLKEAGRLADILIVAINSDSSTRKLKGNLRPILEEEERIQVLTHLPGVDYVVVFDEDHPGKLIRELKPDIYVKGKGISRKELPELEALEDERVEIVILPELCPTSSGKILKKMGE